MIKMEDDVEREAHYTQSSQVYKKLNTIMTKVMKLDADKEGKKRLIYTDGTGCFPKQSDQVPLHWRLGLHEGVQQALGQSSRVL